VSETRVQMPASTGASTPGDARQWRYRMRERALWDHYGVEADERFIAIGRPAVRLRVVEVGAGRPVLFVPGSAGVGPFWGELVRELPGCRCLLLDRPGWGLSAPVDFRTRDYGDTAAEILRNVLDALGIDRADVVGASIGDLWAMRLAAEHPGRVGAVVLLGGGPVVRESGVPRMVRLVASPLGGPMVRLPATRASERAFLRSAGHRASLRAGRIPNELLDWRVGLERHTGSMRSERAMIRAVVSWRTGLRTGIPFAEEQLRAVAAPTLLVYGRDDPVGTVELWRRVVGLLPNGTLELVDGAGHMPWLDDPVRVGGSLIRFLGRHTTDRRTS
jgi:2-hydroxy-6-oxonona-2,4-dienedioate hydrolase